MRTLAKRNLDDFIACVGAKMLHECISGAELLVKFFAVNDEAGFLAFDQGRDGFGEIRPIPECVGYTREQSRKQLSKMLPK